MTDDLIARLRWWGEHGVSGSLNDLVEAADRIEALNAEVARLREALKRIEAAPAWGYPERWETTPAEVRQIARAALGDTQ